MATINGFVGLGKMGSGMARNMFKKTGSCVVWNRSREKVDELVKEGLEGAASLADVAQKCDVICTCLANPAAVRNVIAGPDGLAENGHPGQYIIEMSTIDHTTTLEMYELCKSKGINYIDIPVSGATIRAADGTLSLMCGCTEEEAKPVQHVLDSMSRVCTYLGKRGNGVAAKLIHNAISLPLTILNVEAAIMADYVGITREQIFDILLNGAANNGVLALYKTRLLTGDIEGGHSIRLALKDMNLAAKMCEDLNCPAFTLNNSIQWFNCAAAQGYMEKDVSALLNTMVATCEGQNAKA